MGDEIEAEHEYNFNADLPLLERFEIYYMFFNTDTSLLEKLNTKHVAV